MAKISVSLDDELLARVRARAPDGNVSAYLADAAERRLRNDALREYAAKVEEDSGPLTAEELDRARQWLSSATPPS